MQNVHHYFLESITSHLSDLMELLGDDWPDFRERLLRVAATQPFTESRLSEWIIEAGTPGPAGALIRKLMREALMKSGATKKSGQMRGLEWAVKPAATESPIGGSAAAALVAKVGSVEQPPPGEHREIVVTGHAADGAAVTRFEKGVPYRLRCRVDSPTAGNLAVGDTAVEDVPAGGLHTLWVITSSNVEFVPALSEGKVVQVGRTWLAEFALLIPQTGASHTRQITVLGPDGPGELLVTLYTLAADGRQELYREVTVSLADTPTVTADVISKSPQFTHLRTTHEWTTPWEHIQVSLKNGVADISTKRHRLEVYEFVEPFDATSTLLNVAIGNVRDSLDKFRELQQSYLEDLDPNDMHARLGGWGWQPNVNMSGNGWQLPDGADQPHKDAFAQVQQTDEWRALASDGFALYDRCFPEGTQLRALLDKMVPGNRVDFHWTEQSGAGFVSHVPWALMYMERVDVTGRVPPDPEKFMGLRFRIGSRSWRVNNGSVVLGGLDNAHAMNILYWGRKPGDDVGVEAEWQAREYGGSKLTTVLPDTAAPDLKRQIVLALDAPGPSPIAVIYFYCHCSVGDGSQPLLRFGSTSKREDTLGRNDLSQKSIPDGPLIFANACSTAQADPHMTSELEQAFFKRGVRAFIGTETKVPIKLASKFAWLYFQFFYRRVDPKPMPAGEALMQARMFLWTQYRNVGGLFYSMSNQYDLYLASPEEVLNLR